MLTLTKLKIFENTSQGSRLSPTLITLVEKYYINGNNTLIHFIAFPVQSLTKEVPFTFPIRDISFPTWSIPSPNWNNIFENTKITHLDLTYKFNAQVNDNYVTYEQLTTQCTNPYFKDTLHTININEKDEVKIIRDYYPEDSEIGDPGNTETKDKICKVFNSRSKGYLDTISRDIDVLGSYSDRIQWDSPTYALVLLKENNIQKIDYFGHIYVWISPINPSICFAQGIRNRVDSPFIGDENIKGISRYIFESVRQFALSKECNQIIVPNPLPVMQKILKGIGFSKTSIEKKLMGKSLGYMHPSSWDIVCSNCYLLNNISQSILKNCIKINGILYE